MKDELVASQDDALDCIFGQVEHAISMAAEAYRTPDNDDESGEGGQPVHRYADFLVKEAMPLAVLGMFALAYRARANEEK